MVTAQTEHFIREQAKMLQEYEVTKKKRMLQRKVNDEIEDMEMSDDTDSIDTIDETEDFKDDSIDNDSPSEDPSMDDSENDDIEDLDTDETYDEDTNEKDTLDDEAPLPKTKKVPSKKDATKTQPKEIDDSPKENNKKDDIKEETKQIEKKINKEPPSMEKDIKTEMVKEVSKEAESCLVSHGGIIFKPLDEKNSRKKVCPMRFKLSPDKPVPGYTVSKCRSRKKQHNKLHADISDLPGINDVVVNVDVTTEPGKAIIIFESGKMLKLDRVTENPLVLDENDNDKVNNIQVEAGAIHL